MVLGKAPKCSHEAREVPSLIGCYSALKNYWHVLLPFVLLLRYLVWGMCNLQTFEVYYCLTVQSVLLRCNFSAAFLMFFPDIIYLKDSTGFSLSTEQHPFLLSAPATIWIYQHAHFQWKDYISSWMEVLIGFLVVVFWPWFLMGYTCLNLSLDSLQRFFLMTSHPSWKLRKQFQNGLVLLLCEDLTSCLV